VSETKKIFIHRWTTKIFIIFYNKDILPALRGWPRDKRTEWTTYQKNDSATDTRAKHA